MYKNIHNDTLMVGSHRVPIGGTVTASDIAEWDQVNVDFFVEHNYLQKVTVAQEPVAEVVQEPVIEQVIEPVTVEPDVPDTEEKVKRGRKRAADAANQ